MPTEFPADGGQPGKARKMTGGLGGGPGFHNLEWLKDGSQPKK